MNARVEDTDKLPMPTPEELDVIFRTTNASLARIGEDIQKIAVAIMRMCNVTDALAESLRRHEEALAEAGLIDEE